MKLPKGGIRQRYWQFNKQMSPRVLPNQAALTRVEFGKDLSVFKDRSKSISITQKLKTLDVKLKVKAPEEPQPANRLGQVSYHNFAFTSAAKSSTSPQVDLSQDNAFAVSLRQIQVAGAEKTPKEQQEYNQAADSYLLQFPSQPSRQETGSFASTPVGDLILSNNSK